MEIVIKTKDALGQEIINLRHTKDAYCFNGNTLSESNGTVGHSLS